MNRKPTLYWNEKIVMGHLMHAASIHRRMPPVRVQGYFTLWPDTLKDDWERLYDAVNAKTTLGSPMPAEVSYHEDVMEWLREIDRHKQQIVWSRANRIPWKILTEEFGRSKVTLWHRMNEGLYYIALHLNRIDPAGERFRLMQLKANGITEHV